MGRVLRQNRDLVLREVDGQIFLIDEAGGAIHHLNETASAIWRLLEQPASQNAVIREFRFLFPDEEAGRIKRSIREALRDLADRGILIRERRRLRG